MKPSGHRASRSASLGTTTSCARARTASNSIVLREARTVLLARSRVSALGSNRKDPSLRAGSAIAAPFCSAKRGPLEALAGGPRHGTAGEDVQMQMEDRLAGVRAFVDDDAVPPGRRPPTKFSPA